MEMEEVRKRAEGAVHMREEKTGREDLVQRFLVKNLCIKGQSGFFKAFQMILSYRQISEPLTSTTLQMAIRSSFQLFSFYYFLY